MPHRLLYNSGARGGWELLCVEDLDLVIDTNRRLIAEFHTSFNQKELGDVADRGNLHSADTGMGNVNVLTHDQDKGCSTSPSCHLLERQI